MNNYENKVWFRIIKVIYIITYISVVLIAMTVLYSDYGYVSSYDIVPCWKKAAPDIYNLVHERDTGIYSDYKVAEFIDANRTSPDIGKCEKEIKQNQLLHAILYTPVVIFFIWLSFLVINRIFFYIVSGQKFLRMPNKLFD